MTDQPPPSLLRNGWRQGTIFSAPSLRFASNELDPQGSSNGASLREQQVKAKDRLVLVSQDCDIREHEDKEPYVEALVCKHNNKSEFLAQVDRHSARWFLVDPQTGLVAWARYRVDIRKSVLSTLTPDPWPSTPERLHRFVGWLARRYERPAIPDEMVLGFEVPAQHAIAALDDDRPRLGEALNHAVAEVRVTLPENDDPPYQLELVFLLGGDELSQEGAEAIEATFEAIRSGVDPSIVLLEGHRILTDERMSVAEYRRTYRLFLDPMTYSGDEIEGAEPLGPA
jgi:hypothetical protein